MRVNFLQSFDLRQDPFFMMPLITDKDLRLFVNREEELEDAVDAVLLGKNLLIVGQWGIGKTSFINALRHTLSKKKENLVFVDVRLPAHMDSSKTHEASTLLIALALELEKRKSEDKRITLERMREHQEYVDALSNASIEDLLLVIEASIKKFQRTGKKLIFIFDDVDKISFDLIMLAGIRDSLWKMNSVFVFTSSRSQYLDLVDSAMEPFFTIIFLKEFNEFQAKKLIETRIRFASEKGIQDFVDPNVIPFIQRLSQGNPRRILHLCSFAFRQAYSRGAVRVTESDLSEYVMKQIELETSSPKTELLKLLFEYPQGLSVSELHRKLTKRKISCSRSRVSQILRELSDKGLLEAEKKGRLSIYKSVLPVQVKSK